MGRSTVKEYLARAAAADLAWPLPDDLTDAVLDERLFAASGSKPGARRRAEPDWASLAREMPQPACYCIRVSDVHVLSLSYQLSAQEISRGSGSAP